MPELPEVEIITRELNGSIVGKSILETYSKDLTLRQKKIPNVDVLVGQEIKHVKRRNKYVLIYFNDNYLVIHLGMTGQLLLKKKFEPEKHIHFYLKLNDFYLVYKDPRRFGAIGIFENSVKEIENPYLKNLGFEPLVPEFTLDVFIALASNSKSNIKKFLMNSNIICGIGNIYACEILFLSLVSPLKTLDLLTKSELELIYKNINLVLTKAISLGGSTISDYVHTNGASGEMQNFYNVYAREGTQCKVCNEKIIRIKQFGRSTYYCGFCQI